MGLKDIRKIVGAHSGTALKSDQNGIESPDFGVDWLTIKQVEIRPKWD